MTTPKNTKRTTKTKKDSGYAELAEGIMNGAPPANLRRPSEAAKPVPRNVRTPEKFIADLMVVLNQKIAMLAIEGAAAKDYESVIALLRAMEDIRDRQQVSGKLYFVIVNDVQYRPYVEQVLALAGLKRETLTEDFNELRRVVR